jgi:competence protein ComEC
MNLLKTLLQSNKFYICLFIIIFIYVIINVYVITYNSKYDINTTAITGKVKNIKKTDTKISLTVSGKEDIICNYYLKNKEDINIDNIIGSRIILSGKISEIKNNTIPNNFNYKKYLYNKKIFYNFTIEDFSYKKSNNIFYIIKNKLYKSLEKDTKVYEYLNLFILGNKVYLDSDMYNLYLSNGVVHLFAISGMHISLITSILDRILRIRKKRIVITSFLWLYAFLVSFSISILRSVIFYSLKYILDILDIKVNNKKILFLDAFILLILNPFNILDVGFLYSFSCLIGIFYYCKSSNNYIKDLFNVSLVTTIFTIPITATINYEINLFSIINNLIFIPLVTFIIYPLSIITYIFPFLSNIYNILLNIMEGINQICSNIEVFKFIIPRLSIGIWFIYYIVIIILKRVKYFYIFLSIFILIINISINLDNSTYVYIIDVSQGDSSIIKTKDLVILIDSGGLINSSYNVSSGTIKLLKSIGVNKINYYITSHGDYDHVGDSVYLINNFNIDEVIFNMDDYNELEEYIIDNLEKKNIKYSKKIEDINIKDGFIKVISSNKYDNENDNSNIVYLDIHGISFLFMGDSSLDREKELINDYNFNNIDFLKVGHHGSKTSTSKEFISSINPKYSLISVGKNNRYGHPKDEVLETLSNSKIYRTDIDGSIEIKINNGVYKIKTYNP